MRAAIYARYSSENQRPESIEDQIAACRRLATQRNWTIVEDHIYTDEAQSGARRDRQGLTALLAAAQGRLFDVVLVDDLSRLARDNYLMLTVLAELQFAGVNVVSVADGLDSHDAEATLGIQIRGIFNELQLQDLKKKTLRGQIGQKQRGFSVGEHPYGYTSIPVGATRVDKKGRERPEGYKFEIEPREAGVVLRVFHAYAAGQSVLRIARILNRESVPGRFRAAKGWSPTTVGRILDNEKYIGRWVWNKRELRRDPRTGRRRAFAKPASEWITHEDEALRIVPQDLWDTVHARRQLVRRNWPGGKGQRGFSGDQRGRQHDFPTHLLSGAMVCGQCGASIAQVSGKGGGYYGCLAASRGACDNKLLVRRALVEKIILDAVRAQLSEPEQLYGILQRVAAEVQTLYSHVPETIRLKEAELAAEERRLANFVHFIGEGRGSRTLAQALVETEQKVDALHEELTGLQHSREQVFQAPPIEWVQERVAQLQEILERSPDRSGVLLRNLLGPMRLIPTKGDIGRPYYTAHTSLNTLALLEAPEVYTTNSEGGSNSLHWWAREDLNLGPLPCQGSALTPELRARPATRFYGTGDTPSRTRLSPPGRPARHVASDVEVGM